MVHVFAQWGAAVGSQAETGDLDSGNRAVGAWSALFHETRIVL